MKAPLSILFIGISIGLFATVQLGQDGTPARTLAVAEKTGVLSYLEKVSESDLNGLFQLWNGEWWRLLTTGYHHGDILHLMLNCYALALLGILLEPRMTKLGYFLFFNSAIFFTILSEAFLEHGPVGISGGLCAMFGYLLVLRKHDAEVAEKITDPVIKRVWFFLVVCLVLTQINILSIANTAHFMGVAYGWVVAQLVLSPKNRSIKKLILAGIHLVLLPILVVVITHPVWLGRFWWYEAIHEDYTPEERLYALEKATQKDPSLSGAWIMLSGLQLENHSSPDQAWETALQNLKFNRGDDRNWNYVRDLGLEFRQLKQPEQQKMIEIFSQQFGEEDQAWENQLWGEPLAQVFASPEPEEQPEPSEALNDLDRFLLDFEDLAPVELFKPNSESEKQPFDPDAPDSALHGQTL